MSAPSDPGDPAPPPELVRRWERTAQLVARLRPHVPVDPLPDGLLEELAAVHAEQPQPRELRVVVLDVTPPGTSYLADALTGGWLLVRPAPGSVRMPSPALGETAPVTVAFWPAPPADGGLPVRQAPAAASLPMTAGIRLRWTFLRPHPDEAPTVRAELLAAHAAVVLTCYRDVVAEDGHFADVAERLGPWLPLVAAELPRGLFTLAVDGVEASGSGPANRLGWTRLQARARLPLPASWPATAIVEISSRDAVEQMLRAADREPEAWRRAGITALLARTVQPYHDDPARHFTVSAVRRCHNAFARTRRVLTDVLDGGDAPPGTPVATLARQGRARLVSRGLLGVLARQESELAAAAARLT